MPRSIHIGQGAHHSSITTERQEFCGMSLISGRRRVAVAGAVVSLTAATLGIGLSAPAGAAPGCRVDYTPNDWGGGGFGAGVKITNLGDAVSGWTLKFTF